MTNVDVSRLKNEREKIDQFLNKINGLLREGHNIWREVSTNLRNIIEGLARIVILNFAGNNVVSEVYNGSTSNQLIGANLFNRANDALASRSGIIRSLQSLFGACVDTQQRNEVHASAHNTALTPAGASMETQDMSHVFATLDLLIPATQEIETILITAGDIQDELIGWKERLSCIKAELEHLKNEAQLQEVECLDFTDDGSNYILFASSEIDEATMENLLRVDWRYVFDYGTEAKGSFFEKALRIKKPCIQPIDKDTSSLYKDRDKTNWMFIRGRDGAKTVSDGKKELMSILRRHAADIAPGTYHIVNILPYAKTNSFIDEHSDLAKQLVQVLIDRFMLDKDAPVDEFNNRFKILTIGVKDVCDTNQKIKLLDVKPENIGNSPLKANEYFENAAKKNCLPSAQNWDNVPLGTAMSLGEKKKYNSSGIFFIADMAAKPQKEISDFFCGYTISYDELRGNCDIERKEYANLYTAVLNKLPVPAEDQNVLTLLHQPGAGATTMAARLAYDLIKGKPDLNDRVVFIRKKTADTSEKLALLSSQHNNRALICICDLQDIKADEFQSLRKELKQKSVKAVWLKLESRSNIESRSADKGLFRLKSDLSTSSKAFGDFSKKYHDVFAGKGLPELTVSKMKGIEESLRANSVCPVIFFPYYYTEPIGMNEELVSRNPDNYVSDWLRQLPEGLRHFCQLVAFEGYFSGKGIHAYTFKGVWEQGNQEKGGGKNLTLRNAYSYADLENLKHLLKEENDAEGQPVWKVLFKPFASSILKASHANWETALLEYSLDFINSMSEPDEKILNCVFLEQAKTDWRYEIYTPEGLGNKEGDKYTNLSQLIRRLLINNQMESARKIFEHLINKYNENAHFKAHYGRLLFEWSYGNEEAHDCNDFSMAQKYIEDAIELIENDDQLYHISGMLNSRRAAAVLRQYLREEINEENAETLLVKYTDQAIEDFDESRNLAPNSLYCPIALGNLLKNSIVAGQKIRGLETNDYSHCENRELPYMSYLEKLGEQVERLSSEGLDPGDGQSYKLFLKQQMFLRDCLGNDDASVNKFKKLFDKSRNDEKIIYGHFLSQARYNRASRDNGRGSLREILSNLSEDEALQWSSELKSLIAIGDLASYQKLFRLKRYHYQEKIKDTIPFLKQWKNVAEKQTDRVQRLESSFYLLVAYSAILSNTANAAKNVQNELRELIHITTTLAKECDRSTWMSKCFLGASSRDSWSSILDYNEAVQKAAGRIVYARSCRRVTARIQTVWPNGKATVQSLEDITFSTNGFSRESEGSNIENAVIGIGYASAGLYGFNPSDGEDAIEGRPLSKVSTKVSVPHAENGEIKKNAPLKALGEQDSEKTRSVPRKIDVSGWKPRVKNNTLEQTPPVPGERHCGELIRASRWEVHPDDKEESKLLVQGQVPNELKSGDRVNYIVAIKTENGQKRRYAADVRACRRN